METAETYAPTYNLVVALPMVTLLKLDELIEALGYEDISETIRACVDNTWLDIHPDADEDETETE